MKTSRIPISPGPIREPFGLVAIIKSKRTILPLKGVECDFSVVSGIAEVTMTQIFRQENKKPLDCEYLFPLPADASVYHCEADINGRSIRAQVRGRQEARQVAAKKKAAGYRTALVESERENLFTLALGNIQSGDFVIIQLKYFQTLRSLDGMPSIEIPFCPGIRYIPGSPLLRSNKGKGVVNDTDQVPDASRITPVRIDAQHPDAAYVEVRGRLDGKFIEETALRSPSHAIVVERTGDELRLSLSDKGEVPDRDFVLRWSEKPVEAVASRVWMQQKGAETYALLEIRATRESLPERPPVDFYFLVDRSGSMAGEKWNKAAEALVSCMKVLGPDDRAMITFFESNYEDFREGPMTARELLRDGQFQAIKHLGTAGGTELAPALSHVLKLAATYSTQRDRNLILITDAQIGNESAILELMKTTANFPVHCFGIEVALNDAMLLALSRQQGGTFHSLNPNEDIARAVEDLGKTLGQPVLLDLQLSKGWEAADATIPNLYAGQIHYLSARSGNRAPLEMTARTASSEAVTIPFDQQVARFEAPYLHWCRSRIQRLAAEGQDREAIALSIESSLLCRLTAFVAWDEAEKVAVATHDLVQPSMNVAGFHIGGGAAAAAPNRVLAKRFRTARLSEETADSTGVMLRENLIKRLFSARWHEPELPIELLKRELSSLCHRAGVPEWEKLVKAIFDWIAETKGDERSRRIEAVSHLVEEIKKEADVHDRLGPARPQNKADAARQKIDQLLKAFVDEVELCP